ncbi:VID27-like protein, partial [Dendrobium catenatum]|uniref:VID27-like protein n=1 Tax=Dendrobium catenatum TaxID=906689 RepID=UPI0010A0317E
GVTPEPYVRGSAAERSRWKGKQVWRPKPRKENIFEERISSGVTSGAVSRRSAPANRTRQKWVQKKAHNDDNYNDSRHPGESSRRSRHSPTSAKEEVHFDRSPQIEKVIIPSQEPEIQWRRRSEIQIQEDEEEYVDDDTMEIEVVRMVSHVDVEEEEDDGDEEEQQSQPRVCVHRRRHRVRSIASRSARSSEEGDEEEEEVGENSFAGEDITLTEMRNQMR